MAGPGLGLGAGSNAVISENKYGERAKPITTNVYNKDGTNILLLNLRVVEGKVCTSKKSVKICGAAKKITAITRNNA